MSNSKSVSFYRYKDNRNSFLIGEADSESKHVNYQNVPKLLFKYTSLNTAKTILNSQSLQFSVPTVFPDKREGALYQAAITHLDKSLVGVGVFYTCCFTMAKISEDFTQIYSANSLYQELFNLQKNSMLAKLDVISNSIGICFKFSRKNFRKSLLRTLDDKFSHNGYKLLEGKMRYYSKNTIDKTVSNPEMQSNYPNSDENTNQLFNSEFCELIVKKNSNFIHENEYRYFVGLNDKSKDDKDGKLIFNVDFKDCLEEIFIYANQEVLINEFDKTYQKMKEVESEIKEICAKNKILDLEKVHIIDLYNLDGTPI